MEEVYEGSTPVPRVHPAGHCLSGDGGRGSVQELSCGLGLTAADAPAHFQGGIQKGEKAMTTQGEGR